MYLLIRVLLLQNNPKFTYLHSIMYLLILKTTTFPSLPLTFTFHNVSINSIAAGVCVYIILNLHSIMYLLIPSTPDTPKRIRVFTFHNVSINSKGMNNYVSIRQDLHSIMYLLILFSQE